MRKLAEHQQISNGSASVSPNTAGGGAVGPGLLVVAAIILLVFVVSAAIHVLLRFFSQKPSSSVRASSPLVVLRRGSASVGDAAPAASPPSPSARGGGGMDDGEKDLIESLPLFTLASSVSALPKSSLDCAVCLSRFHLHDQLRLLPSCRHAFHSTCIDTWLRSNLSCPLCRSSIVQEAAPPPTPAPPTAPAATTAVPAGDRSGSFRVEIGSVSRRRGNPSDDNATGVPHSRSFSLGSSFHYVVEEEMDAVINSVAANIREQRRKELIKDARRAAPEPPGESVAEAAGGGGSRGWLMDYMERLASSASSSFSSLRFAGCGSRRIDGDVVVPGSSAWWWDFDGRQRPAAPENEQQQHDDDVGSINSFFRWLAGA